MYLNPRYRDKVAIFLFILFEILYFVTRVVVFPSLIANFLIALCGIMGFVWCFCYPKKILRTNAVAVALVFSMFFLLSNLYTSNSDYTEVIWIWGFIGISLLVINFKIPYILTGIIYYTVCAYFLLCNVRGLNPENVITMGSRNTVSAIVICYMLIYLMLRYMQSESIDIIASIVALIVCFWGMGRAGILVSSMTMFFLILYNLFRRGHSKFKIIFFTIVIVFVGHYIVTRYFASVMETAMLRFDRMGIEDVRKEFTSSYLNDCKNIINLILGVPFSNNALLKKYYNPHNSWLMLHAKYGVIPTAFVLVCIVKSSIAFLKKREWVMLLIVMIAFLRCYMDWIAFNGLFDILWWYIILSIVAQRGVNEYEK